MEWEKRNYYEILEIPSTASPQEIEQAYLRTKNAYSGDSVALYSLLSHDECSKILDQVEEAYSILGFPEKRREYDRIRGFNIHGGGQSAYQRQHYQAEYKAPSPNLDPSIHYEDYGSNKMEAKVSKVAAHKKFNLDYVPNAEMDSKIENATEFSGPFLKEIREYKQVSVERLADMTRVSRSHINAIEQQNHTSLPADVYVRGYVYQLAKCLKLDPDKVATKFMIHYKKMKSSDT